MSLENQPTKESQGSKVASNLFKYLYKNYDTPLKPEDLSPLTEKIMVLEELVPGIISDKNVVSLDNCPSDFVEPKQDGINSDVSFGPDISTFLDNLQKNNPEEFDALKKKFKGSIIVDLGAGSYFSENYRIACLLGAKGYIGIEPYNWRSLFISCLTLKNAWFLKSGNPSINLVAQDAVGFMKRLPDNSVCLLNAGIGDILTDKNYIKDFEKEMARVLKKGGVCMISNSRFPDGISNTIYNTGFVSKSKGVVPHAPITFVEK